MFEEKCVENNKMAESVFWEDVHILWGRKVCTHGPSHMLVWEDTRKHGLEGETQNVMTLGPFYFLLLLDKHLRSERTSCIFLFAPNLFQLLIRMS